MQLLTRGRMRTAASALTAGALAAAALTFAGSPAQADDAPSVDVTVSFDDGIDVTVDGSNFNPASRPGAAGVYVAIAEKQDIVTAPGDVDFFSQAWVMPMQFDEGSFTTTLDVDPLDVEAGKEYAVYTWTAHGNPTAGDSQYTETDVVLTEAPVVAAEPMVTASVKSANPADGLALQIQGTDFTALPTGVYVGVAPADVEIDWSDSGSQGAFIGINWVSAAQFDVNGTSFTTVVNLPTKKLKKGTDYVIHTARAHGLPDRSQDTVTSVVVPFDKLAPKKVTPAIKLAKKPTSKKKGKATVSIKTVAGWKAAQGKVKVALKKGKATKQVNGKLNKAGKVTVKLPKLAKGTWTITAKYAGDKSYKVAKKVAKVKIKK
ncbi:hypothetical protein ASG90_02805 [Nocardioides sp. Soil797]|nr:hypothetical protein ASG90_02805 [Nocardioides sp. Soil797]